MKTVDYTKKRAGAVADRYDWMDADGSKHVTITRYETCPKCGRVGLPMTVTTSGIREFLHGENQTLAGWPVDGTDNCIVVPAKEMAR